MKTDDIFWPLSEGWTGEGYPVTPDAALSSSHVMELLGGVIFSHNPYFSNLFSLTPVPGFDDFCFAWYSSAIKCSAQRKWFQSLQSVPDDSQ